MSGLAGPTDPATALLNGESFALAADCSVATLVSERAGSARGIAVAVNGELVPRSAWSQTLVQPDDRIELLTAAQGG